MVAVYPSELPPPLQDDYQQARGEGRYRSNADAGPPNVRTRFSAVADTVAFSTMLDRAERARFDRFYIEEIKRGALPFYLPDPGTDGWAALTYDGEPILTYDGDPVLMAESWLCLMGARLPVMTVIGLSWRVSFEVTVLP